MATINQAHYGPGGMLLFHGELILLFCDGVTISVSSPNYKETGRLYLTTHRMVFTSRNTQANFKSLSAPFFSMSKVELEQPIFGANYIAVQAKQAEENLPKLNFKLKFMHGGAIEYGQAMHNAVQTTLRNSSTPEYMPMAPPPAYTPSASQYYQAPPHVYQPAYNCGFSLPNQVFDQAPPAGFVFMSDAPPPYPGLTPAVSPPTSNNGSGIGFNASTPGYVPASYPAPGQGSTSYPAPGQGSTSYPAPGQGSTSYPAPGQGSNSYPAPGQGSTSYPTAGYVPASYPAPGQGSASYPNPGQGSAPYPNPGQGSNSYPNPGQGSAPYPNPGHGSANYPNPGHGSAPYPNPGQGSVPYPSSGGGLYPGLNGDPISSQPGFNTPGYTSTYPQSNSTTIIGYPAQPGLPVYPNQDDSNPTAPPMEKK